ncbi:MAG: CBS domain-containing protein [Alphaproteobacteria bacterium]|nr:CBS domain-containing protein [Alphaproteobacteria bacterium]
MDFFNFRSSKFLSITQDYTLEEAIHKMTKAGVGFLPVVKGNKDKKIFIPIGLLTKRNIIERCVVPGKDPKEAKVNEIFTPHIIFGSSTHKSWEIFDLLHHHNFNHVLIKNHHDKLIGIASKIDTNDGIFYQGKKILASQKLPVNLYAYSLHIIFNIRNEIMIKIKSWIKSLNIMAHNFAKNWLLDLN